MAEIVQVSVIGTRNYRAKKTDEYTTYRSGIQPMPVEHARALGLLHRIVRVDEQEETVTRDPFATNFDERLTGILNDAGITNMEQLRSKSDDELLAIDGVGPAAMTRIKSALRGA